MDGRLTQPDLNRRADKQDNWIFRNPCLYKRPVIEECRLTLAQAKKRTRTNGEVTRAKILDAAETLFGDRGFDAVSLREITVNADVTLALASYHFGTKEKLFEEVVVRRATILGQDRLNRLKQLENPTVETIVDAFMAPLFERAGSDEQGWSDYVKVLGRLGEGNQWLHILDTHFNTTAQTFINSLCEVLPGADRSAVARSFMMMLHLMLSTVSQHGRIDQLSDGVLQAADVNAAYQPLLAFCTAGLLASTA